MAQEYLLVSLCHLLWNLATCGLNLIPRTEGVYSSMAVLRSSNHEYILLQGNIGLIRPSTPKYNIEKIAFFRYIRYRTCPLGNSCSD